eukprot:COSAG01_NODE_28077_length_669_cov_10.975439_2_plen_75_part_01
MDRASIGALYYCNSQYKEALDTYARALQLNPECSEVWHNLGILYECCNQLQDATDCYATALALAPGSALIKRHLL